MTEPTASPSTLSPSSILRALRESPLFVFASRDYDSAGNMWVTVEHRDGLVTWEWSLSADAREFSVVVEDSTDSDFTQSVLRGPRALTYFVETVGVNR